MNFTITRKDIEAIKKVACIEWKKILDRIVEEFDSPLGLVIPPAVVKAMFHASDDVQKSVLEGVFPKFGDQKFTHLLERDYPVGIMPDGKEWIESNVNYLSMGWHHANNDYVKRLKYGTFHTFDMCESINRKLEDGWRIPTRKDYEELIKSIDNSRQLLLPSNGGTDEFGLGIVCGGCSYRDGDICRHGIINRYWSSTPYNKYFAYSIKFMSDGVYADERDETHFSYSARCVRDVK